MDVFGDGKTALRMGFGRYLSRAQVIEDLLRFTRNPPWTKAVDSGSSGPNDTLATNPAFRSLDTIGPGLQNAVVGVSPTAGFQAVDENYQPPESYQWNLTGSREVIKNTVLELSYIGNHGLHLWRRNVPRNDVVPSARLSIAQAIRNGQSTDTLVANNRVLKGLGPITTDESTGDSSYHALQVWVNRLFTERLAFQTAYTWGHAISNVSLTSFTDTTSDPFNYNSDKGDADLDRRHSFVGNAIYVLPSFKQWGQPQVTFSVIGN